MTNYLYDVPNATSGFDAIMVQTITAVPAFMPLLLLFVFGIVFLGGTQRQVNRTGTADYPMWSVIASISCLMIVLIASVTSGFIQLDWLVIVVLITIFCGLWFFLDKRSTEI